MTANCPICRSPVEVDDAKLGADGVKAQCSLCEEVFLVRPPAASPPPVAARSSGNTASASASRDGSGSGSASRRILQEDADGATPRVLVAHDSHAFGELCRTLLEEEGFDVEVVHDGQVAEKVIAETPPSVAILEAGLPKRFGFQLCADAKRKGDVPTRFLLVASIYDRKRLGRSETLTHAPDDFVEPRNVELELIPKVRKLLRGRNEGTGSRPAVSFTRSAAAAEPAPPAQPVAVSAGTEGDIDFGGLFEDDSSAAPVAEAPVAASSNGHGSSTASEAIDSIVMQEAPARDASFSKSRDSEDELWEKALEDDEPRKTDDDELLQTLMQMAKPSEPSIRTSSESLDDLDLPGIDDEAAPSTGGDEMDELEKLAAGGFDSPSTMGGVAPAAGPLEIPSRGPLPSAWNADEDEKAIESDEDALQAILEGVDDAGGTKKSEPPREEPARNLNASMASDGGGFELGGILESDDFAPGGSSASVEEGEGEAAADPDTLMQDGFSELPGAEVSDSPARTKSPVAVVPGGPPADVPTVLRGPKKVGGEKSDPKPDPAESIVEKEVDPVEALLADDGFGKSSSKPAPAAEPEDDDEKSLAEAKRPSFEEDDPLEGLLAPDPATEAKAAPPPRAPATAEPSRTGAAGDAALAAEHEKARRLAKLIVGDILLYNADRVADAVKAGNFFEAMKGDIKDGRDFYDEKVPEAVRAERDYIQEVLEEVIETKKRELGLA